MPVRFDELRQLLRHSKGTLIENLGALREGAKQRVVTALALFLGVKVNSPVSSAYQPVPITEPSVASFLKDASLLRWPRLDIAKCAQTTGPVRHG